MNHILNHFRKSLFYPLFILVFLSNGLVSLFFSWGSIAGMNIYTNISESMKPTIEKGDLVIVSKKNMNTYRVGDIISFYRNYQGRPEIITHRIHDIGGNVYITKGDNNPRPDVEVLRPRLIIGEVIAIVPKIGNWIIQYKSTPSRIAYIVFPMLVILLTESNYLSNLKKSRLT